MIDQRYIERLQVLREEYWAESDAAFAAQDWEVAKEKLHEAIGISAAISALQNYDFDMLTLAKMEEALAE